MLIKDTTYKVQTDIFETENGINIENGAIYLVDNKLKIHIDNEINEIPTSKYKVFTALLTQGGGDSLSNANYDNQIPLVIGQSYFIDDNLPIADGGTDFTNVGAANNDYGTWFIATGTNPIWGANNGFLTYNEGAPIANVLENTIGNVWFTYNGEGVYALRSDALFTDKTFMQLSNVTNINNNSSGSAFIGLGLLESNSQLTIQSVGLTDGDMYNTPIEIRVYN